MIENVTPPNQRMELTGLIAAQNESSVVKQSAFRRKLNVKPAQQLIRGPFGDQVAYC